MPLLQVRSFTVAFGQGHDEQVVLNNFNLDIHAGETVALVGESGSGKSVTAFSLLGLLPRPAAVYKSGEALLELSDGRKVDLLKLGEGDWKGIRGSELSIIFQEPMTSLNPVMKCGPQVSEALLQQKAVDKKAAKAETLRWFGKVSLPDPTGLWHKYPHELSGGQKQRVMIAMAMITQPRLLICDEPTTALDVTVQATILTLLKELQQETGTAILFITHDLGVVANIADRTTVLYRGNTIESGATRSLFAQPKAAYTRALIACRPALHAPGERLPVVADLMGEEQTETPEVQFTRPLAKGSSEILVDIENLVVKYDVKRNWWGKTIKSFTAVNEVSLQIFRGETLGLVGESGCGKTTLGRSLLDFAPPASGTILIQGKPLAHWRSHKQTPLHKVVQFVFQDPYSALNPRLTIGDAIEETLREQGRTQRRAEVARLLDAVALPQQSIRRYPHEFSGGQRQRLVIARALALAPQLLVCDESVSALDVSVQAQVLNLLNDLKRDRGLTLLFISHDLSVVRHMSDRIAVMQQGRIVELGEAEAVYNSPKSEYTMALLAAIPGV